MKRTYEEIESIFNDHLENKLTIAELSRKYGFDPTYQFKKFGFNYVNWKVKDIKKARSLRHAYSIINDFKKIDTPEKAYILGLWFADGTVSSTQASIKLCKNDSSLLEKIQNYLCPDNTLKKEKNSMKLLISSMEFCEQLIKLGCIPNKTYAELHIPKIPKFLYSHFIRGYFDGDGTIFMDRKWVKTNICSICEPFLQEIQNILTENHIESRINVEIREGKTYKVPQGFSKNCKNMYRLFVSKTNSIKLFKEFLYKDATLFLQRKFEKFP